MTKAELLRKYLVEETKEFTAEELETEEITETTWGTLKVAEREYFVGNDEESDNKAAEYIKDSLWAFNADFILDHSKLENYNDRTVDAFRKMQESLCEDANELVLAIVEDIDDFVQDAINTDGRSHFIATYDDEENEIEDEDGETFYIYRLN
jgi:hypothetical protein